MQPTVGQQIVLNGRSAVIAALGEPGPVQAVVCFWPGTLRPEQALGKARPGYWHTKHVVLMRTLDGRWFLDVSQPCSVQVNQDPTQHINYGLWLQAFADGQLSTRRAS